MRSTPETSTSFLTTENLETIEENRRTRLLSTTGEYQELRLYACVEEGQRGASLRGCGKPHVILADLLGPRTAATVKVADGTMLSDDSEIRARWAGYFVELYREVHKIYPRWWTMPRGHPHDS